MSSYPDTSTSSDSSDPSSTHLSGQLSYSSSLYLYTFVATLTLLLVISTAIIIRSVVIRRRHAQLVREAIANGTYVPGVFPPPLNGIVRRPRVEEKPKGPTPKMWEVLVNNNNEVEEKQVAVADGARADSVSEKGSISPSIRRPPARLPYGASEKKETEPSNNYWERIMPISATAIETEGDSPSLVSLAGPDSRPATPVQTSASRWFWLSLPTFWHNRRQASSAPTSQQRDVELATQPMGTTSSNASVHGNISAHGSRTQLGECRSGSSPSLNPAFHPVQLTFLISMPRPPKSRAARPVSTATISTLYTIDDEKGKQKEEDIEETELPVVELGVTTVACRL